MDLLGLTSYVLALCVMASIYGVMCLGLNIQWGYGGLFNIGIAGFFLLGAYTSALVTSPPPSGTYAQFVEQIIAWNLPFPLGLLAAGAVCGVVALLIGLPTLRLGHDYLAIATLGIAETIRAVFINEQWIANGTRGIAGIPHPLPDLVTPRLYHAVYLVIVVIVLIALYLFMQRSLDSPWGRVLRAVRDDELSASTSGKNTFSYRLQALVIGSIFIGIGGALYAHYIRALTPEAFTPLYGTFIIWVMVIVGGSGNNKGVILGAFVVWGIWVLSQFATDLLLPGTMRSRAPFIRFIAIGVLLEVVILTRPRGLLPEEPRISAFLKRARARLGA